jgi:hypothetical protein
MMHDGMMHNDMMHKFLVRDGYEKIEKNIEIRLYIPLGTTLESFTPLLGVLFELCIALGTTLELLHLY